MVIGKTVTIFLVIILGLLILFLYQEKTISDGKLKVVFCDVGQGDGIYVRTPKGADIIIDGGPDNSVLLCLGSNMPFWDRTIDLMILTHSDSDHYTGLIPIAKQYEVLSFATPFTQKDVPGYQTLAGIFKEKGVKQRFVCQGDKFGFPDQVNVKVVWPKSCALGSTEKNDNSVVTVLEYKDLQILLTGDAEENIGNFYQGLVGDIDILKVPHHGSKGGVDEDYLDTIEPEVAVLSSGVKNRYGHPSQSILTELSERNISIYRTDRQGDIIIKSDGVNYNVEADRD